MMLTKFFKYSLPIGPSANVIHFVCYVRQAIVNSFIDLVDKVSVYVGGLYERKQELLVIGLRLIRRLYLSASHDDSCGDRQ